MTIVNIAGAESGTSDLTANTSISVLQDTSEDKVFDAYGAEKWYFTLIDRDGYPRTIHYALDLDGERDRLLAEIAELVEEAR